MRIGIGLAVTDVRGGGGGVLDPSMLSLLAGFWDLSSLTGSPASVPQSGGNMSALAAGGAGNPTVVTVNAGKYLDFPGNDRWLEASGFGTSGPFSLHFPAIIPVAASSNVLWGSPGDTTRALHTATTDQIRTFNYPTSTMPGHLGTGENLIGWFYNPTGGDPADPTNPGLVRIEVNGVPVVAGYGPANLTSNDLWDINRFVSGNGGAWRCGSPILRREWQGIGTTRSILGYYASKYAGLSLTLPSTKTRVFYQGDSITAGNNGGSTTSYALEMPGLLPQFDHVTTWAAGGKTWEAGSGNDAQTTFLTQEALGVIPGRTRNIVVVWLGTNDIFSHSQTGASTYARAQRYIARLAALSSADRVLALMPLSRRGSADDTAVNAEFADFTSRMVAGYAGSSLVTIVRTDQLYTYADTGITAKFPDGTHPSDNEQINTIAPFVKAAILAAAA